jgi:hypothetical protein
MSSPIVSKEGYADQIKVSPGTIDGWMKRHWTRGREYFVIGHTALINRKEANQWLQSRSQQEYPLTAMDSESKSGKEGRSFTRKLSQGTHIARVQSPRQKHDERK